MKSTTLHPTHQRFEFTISVNNISVGDLARSIEKAKQKFKNKTLSKCAINTEGRLIIYQDVPHTEISKQAFEAGDGEVYNDTFGEWK